MIITAQVAVTSSPADFNTDTGAQFGGPTSITILNTGTSTVYLGGSNVTSSNGFPIAAGASFSADAVGVNDLYAVCASGQSSTIAFIYERF